LRWAVFGVAVFIFCFSLLFRQTQYIYMFWAVTAAIWLGGAGSVIIGGLYWKRGTTAAAYSALITGSFLAVTSIVLEQIWPSYHGGSLFPINGQWMWFIAMVSSITIYVLVSLLGKRTYFDLDRLLHRGAYASSEDVAKSKKPPVRGVKALFGITSEFTRRDIVTYFFGLGCTAIWVAIFAVGTVYNLMFDVTTAAWTTFWKYFVGLVMLLGTIVSIWISVGGLREMPALFERLRTSKRDDRDDGSVKEHDVNCPVESCNSTAEYTVQENIK
jgi:SSS family solute:Na+ symporter